VGSVLKGVAVALAGWRGYVFVFVLGALLAGTGVWKWLANAYERQLADLRATHAAEVAAAARDARGWSDLYREFERNAGLARDNIMAQARKEADDEKIAAAAALAEYRAGTRRLSLAIRNHQAGSTGDVPTDARTASGPGQARAELDPETGGALYAIAVDGNAGIRDANACIDIYNAVRAEVGAVVGVVDE